jgi:hypothetical protein
VHKVTLATLRERLPAGTTLMETVSPGEDSVEVPTLKNFQKYKSIRKQFIFKILNVSYQVEGANTLTWKALATTFQSTIRRNLSRSILQGRSSGGRCMIGRSKPLRDGDGARLTHHWATTRTG